MSKPVVSIDDGMLAKVEKKIGSKCDFIDWRYRQYHFENGTVLETEEILNILQ